MLVQPVKILNPYQERVIEFKGLNREHVIDDGELRDMRNLSSDEYPTLYQRKARSLYELPANLKTPYSMIAKSDAALNRKLAIVGEDMQGKIGLWYGSERTLMTGLSATTQMVAINTRICFFPEKKFYNVITGEIGDIEARFPQVLVDSDNDDPQAEKEAAKEYVTASITTTDDGQTLTFPSGTDLSMFKVDDAINIEGDLTPTSGTTMSVSVSCVIKSISGESMVVPSETFIELTVSGTSTGTIDIHKDKMNRVCPDLAYVIEYNNRLWGCSNTDNTIYACKLGDPTNWQYYQNTSMDSYYAEQGTDGEWTGVAAYSSHLMFFKEDCIHRVYGSTPSAFQTSVMQCHGLEKGSAKSAVIVNDIVMYKSKRGIMAYEGGTPYCISDKFGSSKYNNVVAGTDGIKYYASILKDGKPLIVVLDLNRQTWHKEDELRVKQFCRFNDKLLMIAENTTDGFEEGSIYMCNGDNPLSFESKIKWMAEFGPFDEYIENKKVYSKLMMRFELPEGSTLHIYMSIDGGEWESIDYVRHEHQTSLFVPIVPRRCNRFSVKLEGVGNCRIESLTRQFREGGAR